MGDLAFAGDARRRIERTNFEVWASEKNGWPLAEVQQARAGDTYMNDRLAHAWDGWQARSANPPVRLQLRTT